MYTMRRFIVSAAALVGFLTCSSTATAQYGRNVIVNSGNGVNNTIVAQSSGVPVGGWLPGPILPGPFGGGVHSNWISNSGNGIGNTIIAGSGGSIGFGGWYPGGGVFPGGVNVNVVTNSGNGIGNQIITGNRGAPGGLNINVITNSGNGAGNTIVTRNR
jgi:hypothetical protein